MTQRDEGLVPVHVAEPLPGTEEPPRRDYRGNLIRRPRPIGSSGIDWLDLGIEPRWLGMDSSDCAAALNPSGFAGQGAEELDRFLAGAATRGEPAIVVATMGDVTDDSPRSPLTRYHASVSFPGLRGYIAGRELPVGTRPELLPDLPAAERDLGLRLLTRAADAPWWSLALGGYALERPGSSQPETRQAEGELQPILVDGLGDPVAAVWVAPEGAERWYVVPGVTPWHALLDWLVHQAFSAYVPGALHRARSALFTDPDLLTAGETDAQAALDDATARYEAEKARIEHRLTDARAAAEPIRYGLLYGTGSDLVDAVEAVLSAAGFTTANLDQELGTKSADLLVTYQGRRRLVEVKSAGGRAPENLLGKLQRHLDTWPQLRPGQPVDGGVLVVNHQHRHPPADRAAQVYERREFVASLKVPVVSTRALFDWWRESDWTSIQAAVLEAGPPPQHPPSRGRPKRWRRT